MPVAIRHLRTHLDDAPGFRPKLSARELDRADPIMAAGQTLMARYGRTGITLGGLAAALRISPATLRRSFPDLDSLLHDILQRHLRAIAGAMGEVPHDMADRPAAARAAYLAYTRAPFGNLTEAHGLLVRDRHTLPPDLLAQIDQHRLSLGQILAGGDAIQVLALLDLPDLHPTQIERLVTTLLTAPPPAATPIADPATPPPAPPATAPPIMHDIPWELISKAPPFPDLNQPRAGPPP